MKDIENIVNEINLETLKESERIVKLVNEDKTLETFFSKWNVGKSLLEERGKEVMKIQKTLRDKGYDVKINMQSYELSYEGMI